MFFTDPNFRTMVTGYSDPAGLPDAVWRLSPTEKLLTPVISRAEILIPNGVRVNRNFTKLSVTDTTPTTVSSLDEQAGGGFTQSGSPAIYSLDATPYGCPYNKKTD